MNWRPTCFRYLFWPVLHEDAIHRPAAGSRRPRVAYHLQYVSQYYYISTAGFQSCFVQLQFTPHGALWQRRVVSFQILTFHRVLLGLQEVGCGYMDWIGLVKDRDRWRTLVSAVMNLRVPWNAGNFLTNCKPVSCSRRTLHHGVSK